MKLTETIKLGRRVVGGLYDTDAGQVFLAYRWIADIQRGNAKDISSAIRDGTAMWAIESDALGELRRRAVPMIGVVSRDTNERFVAPSIDWFGEQSRVVSVRGRSGSFRALPFPRFAREMGKRLKMR